MVEATQDQNPDFVHRAFSSIAKRYVFTNHVLSLGIDLVWRKRVAGRLRDAGATFILDVATGSGDLALTLKRELTGVRLVGLDFCQPMLAEARKRGVGELIVGDGLHLPFPANVFDAVTIAYGLRNMSDWEGALAEFHRVLKPGGSLLILDFSLPENSLLRKAYRFYLHRILPCLGGLLTGNREAYAYLGDSIERFPAGPTMLELISKVGLTDAVWEPQSGGISSLYVARKPC
ncbi:MAG: class I SAM-dependent methyltransferase [Verrucomicrobiae bacterium]|nr:class I SAM-dependent methyltransferase [Verrucomicrobiae bacterium]